MTIRQDQSVKIAGVSPEEFAGYWGGDPVYNQFPNLPGDGYTFYNFSSENQVRDKEYLDEFAAAIERTAKAVEVCPESFEPNDANNLRLLLVHVKSLAPEGHYCTL